MKTFKSAIQAGTFTITGELSLNRFSGVDQVAKQARLLSPFTDAVQVAENPGGRVQMSPQAAAGIVLREGIDAIPHLSTRDRNRLALESDLLGMAALGVTSALLMRGDELPTSGRPPPRQLFDLSGRDLIALARTLAEDEAVVGVPDLNIGAVATVFNPKRTWTPQALLDKAEAGADFIQTQLCFDMNVLRRYMARLIDNQMTWRTAIVVSLAVLPTAVSANWLRENLKGSLVPPWLIQRLEKARDPEREGIEICAELLQQLQDIPGVTGAHLMTPGEPESIAAAIEASGLRAGSRSRPSSAGGR